MHNRDRYGIPPGVWIPADVLAAALESAGGDIEIDLGSVHVTLGDRSVSLGDELLSLLADS